MSSTFTRPALLAAQGSAMHVRPFQRLCRGDRIVARGQQKNEGVYFEYGPHTVEPLTAYDAGQFDWVRNARKETFQRRKALRRKSRRGPKRHDNEQAGAQQGRPATLFAGAVDEQAATSSSERTETSTSTSQAAGQQQADVRSTPAATAMNERSQGVVEDEASTSGIPNARSSSRQLPPMPAAAPRMVLDDDFLSSAFYDEDDPLGRKLKDIEARAYLSPEERLQLKLEALGYGIASSSTDQDDEDELLEEADEFEDDYVPQQKKEITTTGASAVPATLLAKPALPPRRPS